MKITKIENEGDIYSVTRMPNFIERLFGVKERIDKYKSTGGTYALGGGRTYIDQKGRELGISLGYGSDTREAIDCWRRSF